MSLTIENPYVRDLVEHVEFDTIYHEHYCYFSCSSVDALMSRHGLHLNDVEYFPDLHGGSLRWYVGTRPDRTRALRRASSTPSVAAGMRAFAYYAGFAERVRAVPGRACGCCSASSATTVGRWPPTVPPRRARRCSTAPASGPI